MQSLAAADGKNLEIRAVFILDADLPPSTRAMPIGLVLTEHVGADVLDRALTELAPEIKEARERRAQPAAEPPVDDLMARFGDGGPPPTPAEVPQDAPPPADGDAARRVAGG